MTARPSLKGLQLRHWLLVFLATVGAAIAGQPGPGGVLLGGAFIAASVLIYAAGFRILVRRTGSQLAIGMLFVKLAAFLGLGWVLFASGSEHRPDPIGFALGLTCFPAAAVWEAMRARGS